MKFVIMLAFGHPKGDPLRHDLKGFRRKSLEQIADKADPKLEPAGLAPSSINRQPWYFTHEGKTIHVYCVKKDTIGYMNRIDMGIALAHLYVTNAKTSRFCLSTNPPAVPGYGYIRSVNFYVKQALCQ